MSRKILRDDQYARIEGMLPGKATDVGVTAKDNRLFVEAVLWIARTRRAVAGSAGKLRSLEQCVQTLCTLV